jgi:hypothetical protein
MCAQTPNLTPQTSHPKPHKPQTQTPKTPHPKPFTLFTKTYARVCARVQSVASGMREVDGTGLLDYCRRTIDRGADATAASDEEGDAEAD